MTILRIFIHNEDLSFVDWHTFDNQEQSDTLRSGLHEALGVPFDSVEIYLAPSLATIIKINLGTISDRKVNEDYLLNTVEEQLAEDIEHCKPILLRLSDGEAFVAIVGREFHSELLTRLADYVKKVKFIQPFPYALTFEEGAWTVYLNGENKFVRTSRYEYFLLDDGEPIPELLLEMLTDYDGNSLNIYCDNDENVEALSARFKIDCKRQHELHYGITNWNLYNEKSKRFNFKFNPAALTQFKRLGKAVLICGAIFVVYWLLNLGYLLYKQGSLRGQISKDLQGIVANSGADEKYKSNILPQVDDKLTELEHQKGLYAPGDMVSLLDVFLKTMPSVNNSMILGMQYSGNVLNIFLSSQFDPAKFSNDQAIFATKRIAATLSDYKTYQASQQPDNKNNSGGGLADNDSSNSTTNSGAALQDAAWVISLQIISRLDGLDVSSSK